MEQRASRDQQSGEGKERECGCIRRSTAGSARSEERKGIKGSTLSGTGMKRASTDGARKCDEVRREAVVLFQ
eukprot:gene13403-biopygen3631